MTRVTHGDPQNTLRGTLGASQATSTPRASAGTRQRRSEPRRPQARVVGTPAEVAAIVARLGHVVTITSQSRQIPRRDEPGRVAVYLEIRPED